jgi:hypothetical protein
LSSAIESALVFAESALGAAGSSITEWQEIIAVLSEALEEPS